MKKKTVHFILSHRLASAPIELLATASPADRHPHPSSSPAVRRPPPPELTGRPPLPPPELASRPATRPHLPSLLAARPPRTSRARWAASPPLLRRDWGSAGARARSPAARRPGGRARELRVRLDTAWEPSAAASPACGSGLEGARDSSAATSPARESGSAATSPTCGSPLPRPHWLAGAALARPGARAGAAPHRLQWPTTSVGPSSGSYLSVHELVAPPPFVDIQLEEEEITHVHDRWDPLGSEEIFPKVTSAQPNRPLSFRKDCLDSLAKPL
jgi:hypothetical protein